eukprot:76297-Chlamydomonas_euryale.AAC.3
MAAIPSRYFLHLWPKLCYLAYDGDKAFGTVVCKMDMHRDHMRGYVAMLVVDKTYRGKGAGESCMHVMVECDHVHEGLDVGIWRFGHRQKWYVLSPHLPMPQCAGSELVKMAIEAMMRDGCDEVALEAEVVNTGALRLYQNLGFVRDKRLHRYYLNGTDAYRLKLLLPKHGQSTLPEDSDAVNNLDATAMTEMQAIVAA